MRLKKIIKYAVIGLGIFIVSFLIFHSIAIYRYKLSPKAKIRWQNVVNSYQIRIGMTYEEVLVIMGSKPFRSDDRLIDKIVDTSLVSELSPEAYACTHYIAPTIAEDGINIWFDTNFVVSGISYYVDEFGNQPKKITEGWWKIP